MEKEQQVLFERYITIIKDLTDTAETLARMEDSKAVAISHKRHELIESFMKQEQAYILKLRGQDQHRRKLTESLGWESLTFSQILEKSDLEQQACLKPLFCEFEEKLKHLLQSKEIAGRIVNVRIYELLAIIEQRSGVFYDNSRNVGSDEFPHTKLCDKFA